LPVCFSSKDPLSGFSFAPFDFGSFEMRMGRLSPERLLISFEPVLHLPLQTLCVYRFRKILQSYPEVGLSLCRGTCVYAKPPPPIEFDFFSFSLPSFLFSSLPPPSPLCCFLFSIFIFALKRFILEPFVPPFPANSKSAPLF